MWALGAPARKPASRRPSQTPRGCAAAAKPSTDLPSASTRQAFAFTAPWCLIAPRLAHMLDSLVRVSRRVEWNHNQTRRKLQRAPPNVMRRRVTEPEATQQGAQRVQTALRSSEPLPTRRLTRRPVRASTGSGCTQDTTVGGQTTAHPKGLKLAAPQGRDPFQPAHRTAPKRVRCKQTWKHD